MQDVYPGLRDMVVSGVCFAHGAIPVWRIVGKWHAMGVMLREPIDLRSVLTASANLCTDTVLTCAVQRMPSQFVVTRIDSPLPSAPIARHWAWALSVALQQCALHCHSLARLRRGVHVWREL